MAGANDSVILTAGSQILSRYCSTTALLIGRTCLRSANSRANIDRISSRYLVAKTCQPIDKQRESSLTSDAQETHQWSSMQSNVVD